MPINDSFCYLNIGLPEDILRRKLCGDFQGALRLIELRLKKEIPEALRQCLIVERELINRLEGDYQYSLEEAMAIIRKDIPDFTEEEFRTLVDEFKIDWIYVKGSERYFDRFYDTLLKVNKEFAARAKASHSHVDGEDEDGEEEGMLDRVIRIMKEKGSFGVRLRIKATVKIKDEAFVAGKKVRVHIPVAADARQVKNIVIHKTFPEASFIAPPDAAQRTVYFEEVMEENHEFTVEYSYDNVVDYIEPDAKKVAKEQPSFFTAEENPHIVFTPYMKALAKELTAHTDNPLEKARAIYDFITLNVKYSYMREYFGLTDIAENCARNFRGDCGVQALLFITLSRLCGIPAKWQSGLNSSPESIGPHDWAEFYVAPYGWMFADPSFGGGAHRVGAEHRRRFYFGNLDPYRMVANREFQAAFTPDKLHWRCDPYDNQTGEIEYEDKGLLYEEYTRSQELLECVEL
ncbi:MAG TPA: transglutaminase-like domain-containing protein [Clostridia bacterium]|nr:transglutaminase-like domain-containing protein [Clostridia bacterium]